MPSGADTAQRRLSGVTTILRNSTGPWSPRGILGRFRKSHTLQWSTKVNTTVILFFRPYLITGFRSTAVDAGGCNLFAKLRRRSTAPRQFDRVTGVAPDSDHGQHVAMRELVLDAGIDGLEK